MGGGYPCATSLRSPPALLPWTKRVPAVRGPEMTCYYDTLLLIRCRRSPRFRVRQGDPGVDPPGVDPTGVRLTETGAAGISREACLVTAHRNAHLDFFLQARLAECRRMPEVAWVASSGPLADPFRAAGVKPTASSSATAEHLANPANSLASCRPGERPINGVTKHYFFGNWG